MVGDHLEKGLPYNERRRFVGGVLSPSELTLLTLCLHLH